jgi:site-specific DNA-methyltransferase (adenine-specific)
VTINLNRLYVGDCTKLLQSIEPRSIDAVITDPPYNLGQGYDVAKDKKKTSEFLGWCRGWGSEVHRALKPTGTFWCFMGTNLATQVDMTFQSLGFHRLSWVVWHFTFGQHTEHNLVPSFVCLFRYGVRPKGQVLNQDSIRVPSARQLLYNDKRANPKGRVPDNVWVLRPQDAPEPLFDPLGTVWYVPRLCGTFKEKQKDATPNQLPEPIAERLVLLSSNPGQVVLDPFSGSGTIPAVAKRLGRDYIGFDLSKSYIAKARRRLAAVEARNGRTNSRRKKVAS